MFEKRELVTVRSDQINQLSQQYSPRFVLYFAPLSTFTLPVELVCVSMGKDEVEVVVDEVVEEFPSKEGEDEKLRKLS